MSKNILNTVKKLKAYNNSKFPILTVYIGFGGKKVPSIKNILSKFHFLVHSGLSNYQRDLFRKNLDRAEKYLIDGLNVRGIRSIAIFSSKNLFEILELTFPLESMTVVSNSPFLPPIVNEVPERAINSPLDF